MFQFSNERVGDPRDVLARHQRFTLDMRFMLENVDVWRVKYPNSWVAVYNRELVAVADTQGTILQAISGKELPLAEVIIEFLDSLGVVTAPL